MKANSPKSKPKPVLKFEWTDIPTQPQPPTTLEEILIELRKIRETMEKSGTRPITCHPIYPDDRPMPNAYPIPWYPPYYIWTSAGEPVSNTFIGKFR